VVRVTAILPLSRQLYVGADEALLIRVNVTAANRQQLQPKRSQGAS
jgi:hypothetical protein